MVVGEMKRTATRKKTNRIVRKDGIGVHSKALFDRPALTSPGSLDDLVAWKEAQ